MAPSLATPRKVPRRHSVIRHSARKRSGRSTVRYSGTTTVCGLAQPAIKLTRNTHVKTLNTRIAVALRQFDSINPGEGQAQLPGVCFRGLVLPGLRLFDIGQPML